MKLHKFIFTFDFWKLVILLVIDSLDVNVQSNIEIVQVISFSNHNTEYADRNRNKRCYDRDDDEWALYHGDHGVLLWVIKLLDIMRCHTHGHFQEHSESRGQHHADAGWADCKFRYCPYFTYTLGPQIPVRDWSLRAIICYLGIDTSGYKLRYGDSLTLIC